MFAPLHSSLSDIFQSFKLLQTIQSKDKQVILTICLEGK
jgi:hypothetical protein